MPRKSRKKATNNDLKPEIKPEVIPNQVHDVTEKIRQNALVPINKLPIELFKQIFPLARSDQPRVKHRYISYTWVCHHWRSVLVQIPELWAKIPISFRNHPMKPVVTELLKRSGSVKLTIKMSIHSCTPVLEDFLTKESNRIDTLVVKAYDTHTIQQTFSSKRFPSLRRVLYQDLDGNPGFGLLPTLGASENLHTLKCNLRENLPLEAISQLAPALRRLWKLSVTIYTPEILHSVLEALHNEADLHTLELILVGVSPIVFTKPTILPRLQFFTTDTVPVLDGIRAPNLSSLDIQYSDFSYASFENPSVLQEYGASTLKYLHVLDRVDGGHTITALKEPILSKSIFSLKCRDEEEVSWFTEGVNEMTFVDDYLSDPWLRDYLHLNYIVEHGEFDNMLKLPLYAMLPQLTSLSELCLASDTLWHEGVKIEEILAKIPSLEILLISHKYAGDGLPNFISHLGNASLCPRLKHLSYICEESEKPETETVGRLLTENLRSRHKVHGPVLKDIVLGHCPPLPDNWLEEIQKLGAKVLTNKDTEEDSESDSDSDEPDSSLIWGIYRGTRKSSLFDWGPRPRFVINN